MSFRLRTTCLCPSLARSELSLASSCRTSLGVLAIKHKTLRVYVRPFTLATLPLAHVRNYVAHKKIQLSWWFQVAAGSFGLVLLPVDYLCPPPPVPLYFLYSRDVRMLSLMQQENARGCPSSLNRAVATSRYSVPTAVAHTGTRTLSVAFMLAPRNASFCAEDPNSRSTALCRGLKPVCAVAEDSIVIWLRGNFSNSVEVF